VRRASPGQRPSLGVTLTSPHYPGYRLAIGSDAGNFILAQFHGVSTLRELELLAAGVPNADVLQAATRVPARLLGREDEVGTVAVGKRADLVVVRDDPLADVHAMRTVRWTVKAGVAHTPAEWMPDDAGAGLGAR